MKLAAFMCLRAGRLALAALALKRKHDMLGQLPIPGDRQCKEAYMARSFYVDQDECIGCESCVEIAPGAFSFDESIGKASVSNIDGEPEDKIQEAMDTCPASCIHWE